ncbi:MAG: multiheme c-type cytochrome [Planctomycetota bacterium]|jgi:hypothetical protein
MIRIFVCTFVLAVMVLCLLGMGKGGGHQPSDKESITVFLTGSTLGELKPCGCSVGQLGGLEKRRTTWKDTEPSRRLIIDTGLLVKGDSQQDIIKFNVMLRALGLLNYDLVNLAAEDVTISQNLGLLDDISSLFNVISSQVGDDVNLPMKFSKRFLLKGNIVIVTVASFGAEGEAVEKITELFETDCQGGKVNILILNKFDNNLLKSIKGLGVVDCLICPSEGEEPIVIGEPNARPLIFSVGRYGKYVVRLEIKASAKQKTIKPVLNFGYVAVTEDLSQEQSLVELYGTYQQLVKEAGLLQQHQRVPLGDGLRYVGSASCQPCHSYEYEKWSGKAHAHAYETLVKVGSQYDPECVVCHVVGMDYEEGFVSEEKTDHLKNVGCEQCHGPGSEHVEEAGGVTPGIRPRATCTDCHTPEHSGGYLDNEKYYFEKIIHWKEPKTADNVKE